MRPDQEEFDRFASHFESIDTRLVIFCEQHGFELRENVNREPGRVLRREDGELVRSIVIFLDGYWKDLRYSADLRHNVRVRAMFTPPEGNRLVRGQPISAQTA